MTRNESLEFLGLPESASPTDIKSMIAEKLSHFEKLIETTNSDFLKRVYTKNIAAIKEIELDSIDWEPFVEKLEKIEPSHEIEKELPIVEETTFETTQIETKEPVETDKAPELPNPPGWLIKHTENQLEIAFPLMSGKNFIGRKVKPDVPLFTVIDGDPYVSRVHAVIYVEDSNPYDFYISDSNDDNDGNASKNGTYINGDHDRIVKKTKLSENDTIQIGTTKLILKYNNAPLDQILEEVKYRHYINTVNI